jgi:predicted nucleotide-binding protein
MAGMSKKRKRTAGRAKGDQRLRMFIGSSAEALPVTRAVAANLEHDYRVRVWTARAFEPGHSPLEDLERRLDGSDLGCFVFAADDWVITRGKRYGAVRDNVLLELGLFIGRLGRHRCFTVAPRGAALRMPSDLDGFPPARYDPDFEDGDEVPALSGAADEIRAAVTRRVGQGTIRKPASAAANARAAKFRVSAYQIKVKPDGDVGRDIADLLDRFRGGAAGVGLRVTNETQLRAWARDALAMSLRALKQVTPNVPDDAYVAWLRPGPGKPAELSLFEGYNLPEKYSTHRPFELGEGLAGTVWETGGAAMHSKVKPHPQWKTRADCENASYVCVPAGDPASAGGVLSFGSDCGFKLKGEQVAVLSRFVEVAALVAPEGRGGKSAAAGRRSGAGRVA